MKRDQIELCRKGNPRAVFGLVDEYRALVGPLIFAVEGQLPLADGSLPFRMFELSAEAFGAVLRGLGEAPGGPPFHSWARRLVYATMKPRGKHPAYPLPDHDGVPRAAVSEAVPADRLREGVARLLPELRFVLWALCVERMTIPAAADLLNTTPDRLSGLLDMALGELRRYAADEGLATAGQPVAEEARLRPLVYDTPSDAEKRAVEGSTTRFANVQRGLDDLIRERQAIGRAMVVELATSRVLREVRLRHKTRRTGIPPMTWVAAQVVLGVGLVFALIAIGRHVPVPTVTIEPLVGESQVSATAPSSDVTISADEPPTITDDGHVVHKLLRPGQTIRTGLWSSMRLRVNGSNPISLGPGTTFAMRTPTLAMPMHGELEAGVAWFDLRAMDAPVQIDTPLVSLRITRGQGLLDVGDGSVRIALIDGIATWDGTDGEPRWLRAGQGGRLWLTDDGALDGPAPLVEFAPTGYPRSHFQEPSAQKLAIATEYLARLYQRGDGLKTRFHWHNTTSYPLALDAVPPAVQMLLDNFHRDLEGLSQRRRELRDLVERATIRVNDVRRAMADTNQQLRNLELELADMDGRQAELIQLRDAAAQLRADIEARANPQGADEGLFDGDGAKVTALRARIEAITVRLQELRDVEIQRLAAATVLEQLRPQLAAATAELDAATARASEQQAALTAAQSDLDSLQAVATDLATAKQQLADADATARATAERLKTERAGVTSQQAELARLQQALDAAKKLVADAKLAVAARDAAAQAATEAREAQKAAQLALTAASETAGTAATANQRAMDIAKQAASALKTASDKLTAAQASHRTASEQLDKLQADVDSTRAALADAKAALDQQRESADAARTARDLARANLEKATADQAAAIAARDAADARYKQATADLAATREAQATTQSARDALKPEFDRLHAEQLKAQQASDAAARLVAQRQSELEAAVARAEAAEKAAVDAEKASEATGTALTTARQARDAAAEARHAADAATTEARQLEQAASTARRSAEANVATASGQLTTARATQASTEQQYEEVARRAAATATARANAARALADAATALTAATTTRDTARAAATAATQAATQKAAAAQAADKALTASEATLAERTDAVAAVNSEITDQQAARKSVSDRLASPTLSEAEREALNTELAAIDRKLAELDAALATATAQRDAANQQHDAAAAAAAEAAAAHKAATEAATAANAQRVAAEQAFAAATTAHAAAAHANDDATSADTAAQATLAQHASARDAARRATTSAGELLAQRKAELAQATAVEAQAIAARRDQDARAADAAAALTRADKALADATAAHATARDTAARLRAAVAPLANAATDARKAGKDAIDAAKIAATTATAATNAYSDVARRIGEFDQQLAKFQTDLPKLTAAQTAANSALAEATRRVEATGAAREASAANAKTTSATYDEAMRRVEAGTAAHATAEQAHTRANEELARARELFGPAAEALDSARRQRDAAQTAHEEATAAASQTGLALVQARTTEDDARRALAAATSAVSERDTAAKAAASAAEAASEAAAKADVPAATAAAQAARSDLGERQTRVAGLEEVVVRLDAERTRLASRIANLERRLATRPALEQKLTDARNALDATNKSVAALRDKKAALDAAIAPKRAHLDELDKQLVEMPKLKLERDQATSRINDIRRYMRNIEELQSRLQTANYRISALERVAGAEVRAARTAELAALQKTLADQVAIEARYAADEARLIQDSADYERSVYAERLAALQDSVVQQLMVLVGGYRDQSFTAAVAAQWLTDAVRLYPRYRELCGDRRSLAMAASVEQEWLATVRANVAGQPSARIDQWTRLGEADVLPPGEGLGKQAGTGDNSGGPDGPGGD